MWEALLVLLWCWCALFVGQGASHSHRYAWVVGNTSVAGLLQDEGRYGVYATETTRQRARRGWAGTIAGWAGWGRDAPIAVAAFPAARALTAANLAHYPQQGAVLRELQELGLVDERAAVILHLAVERLRLRQAQQQGGTPDSGNGGDQGLLPWLALLPDDFGTTLYFSELDLMWLRGTTLHKATRWVGGADVNRGAPAMLGLVHIPAANAAMNAAASISSFPAAAYCAVAVGR